MKTIAELTKELYDLGKGYEIRYIVTGTGLFSDTGQGLAYNERYVKAYGRKMIKRTYVNHINHGKFRAVLKNGDDNCTTWSKDDPLCDTIEECLEILIKQAKEMNSLVTEWEE